MPMLSRLRSPVRAADPTLAAAGDALTRAEHGGTNHHGGRTTRAARATPGFFASVARLE
jgi:hypothetical protein